MSNEVSINISIKPTWSLVKEIQAKAEAFMNEQGKGKDVIEATLMCVTELIENAVKYGSEKPDGSNIDFDLKADSGHMKIIVTNGIRNESDIDVVVDHIKKIKNSNDPAQLYTERLMELMENPKPGISQLGLYRIAYEGEFKIDYTYSNHIFTIIAEREI